MKLTKGLLSFISGLGLMGLCFYIAFFTFVEMDYKIISNYVLLFSILTSILACVVIYFLSIAFSFIDTNFKINATLGGFIGGILTMVAIVLMILSFRLEDFGWMNNIGIFDSIHPIVTFFLAAASTLLFIWPEEKEEKW
ncbi:MAG: hypothetical protein FE048_01520 [Thermoplasmata archaeon]|nr:MAG: hypothetical protein FE048_01520 [Thermoplasmata archaeon]